MNTAAFLIIGNEILSGRTVDKNLPFLAEKLGGIGIQLKEVRIVADERQAIIAAVNALRTTFTYVFTSGGIGPTHDDITTACIGEALGRVVTRHPEAEHILKHYYKPEDLNAARLKMADIPEGASLIANPVSAAPGYAIENLFILAGVPRIFQAMLDDVLPRLTHGKPLASITVTTTLTEGTLAAGLEAVQKAFPDVPIGSYPHFSGGKTGVSLVARSNDSVRLEACAAALQRLVDDLCS